MMYGNFGGWHNASILICIAFWAGVILLAMWAFKHMKAKDMQRIGLSLVIGSIVLWLLLGALGMRFNYGMFRHHGWYNNYEVCQNDAECLEKMEAIMDEHMRR